MYQLGELNSNVSLVSCYLKLFLQIALEHSVTKQCKRSLKAASYMSLYFFSISHNMHAMLLCVKGDTLPTTLKNDFKCTNR